MPDSSKTAPCGAKVPTSITMETSTKGSSRRAGNRALGGTLRRMETSMKVNLMTISDKARVSTSTSQQASAMKVHSKTIISTDGGHSNMLMETLTKETGTMTRDMERVS